MNKYILLILVLIIGQKSFAQKVQGVVLDADNKALVGAYIKCDSLKVYGVSMNDGSFSVDIAESASGVLSISYMGFKTKKISFNTANNDNFDFGEIIMQPIQFTTEEVSIIGSRSEDNIMNVPADISVVSLKTMDLIPSDKIDQNMKYLPGVFIDRPYGIFGKSVVGLRSIVSSEPGRQLTLIDGVPINKSDGGGTNWNRIIESDFERIEVLKGPGAALYGNNAMGGAVNLVHKRPNTQGVHGQVGASYANYNTYSADLSLQHKFKEGEKSFYYTLAAKGLKSDGFVTVPDSIRTETDTSVFLDEYGANARFGYMFDAKSYVEAEYNYYDEKRGQGSKILLEDGAVALYKTHFAKLAYHNNKSKLKYDVNAFYQVEDYGRDIEKMKKGDYTHIKVNSQREDYGAVAIFRYDLSKHNISFGADYRAGSVYGVDDYQTSTDKVINQGKMNVVNVYAQDNWQISKKIKAIIGLHFASGRFYDGSFELEDPTHATDFMKANTGDLDAKTWNGFSPRLSLQYDFSSIMNIYTVLSHGYRAPSLDDLTRYGFMSIGYKNASPNLTPEQVDNVELGYRIQKNKWALQSNINYAMGHDYMYFVDSGDKLFGRKTIYNKENVTSVQLYGFEVNVDYQVYKSFVVSTNYTINGSKISKFEARPELEGKVLTYVPEYLGNFTMTYLGKKITTSLNIHLQGNMFLDDVNEFEIDPLMSLDFMFNYRFYKGIGVKFSAQNILDEQHMVSSDQMSLGRYMTLGMNYRF
ncbi:MAG: hypothetical protein B6I18_05270 [Bacteroidetes bacterium 4572_112]|nr:MAG: hypothetical protein B6I18_05270 [Bacteroidetes bacterium 4572_112]